MTPPSNVRAARRRGVTMILTPELVTASVAILVGLGLVLLGSSMVAHVMGMMLCVIGILLAAFSAIRLGQLITLEMNRTVQRQQSVIVTLQDRLDRTSAERDEARARLRDIDAR